MKKKAIGLTLLLNITLITWGQEYSQKYGKITNDELIMQKYDKDTSAVALILYSNGKTYYDYNDNGNGNGFRVITETNKKIKILKQEGTSYATISIPYFNMGGNKKDQITGLEAFCYNLENEKIVKQKLEKKYIFDEKINDKYHQLKFSIPGAKEGSVIEYKYVLTDKNSFDIPNQQMQFDIPVKSEKYVVNIPEYFIYNIESRGYEQIHTEETLDSHTFIINNGKQSGAVNCNSRRISYTMTDVPALKDEPHVWNINDFRSSIIFELNGIQFPMEPYTSYTTTWADIESNLKKHSSFFSNINKSSPYSDTLKPTLDTLDSDELKINHIFQFVKKEIKWDGNYSFFDNDPKEAIKKGTGNNVQLNAVLIRTLKDAGYNAYPILMSQRSTGRLSIVHPTISQLSTYIVGVDGKSDPNQKYYLDGSSNYGGVNILPVDLLVERAYAINPNSTEKWVDLKALTKNRTVCILNGSIAEDGTLTGYIERTFTNTDAYYFRKEYQGFQDSLAYVQHLESTCNLKLDSMKIEGMKSSEVALIQRLHFTKKYDTSGNYLYLSPILFPQITQNNFTAPERKLPIEFSYPYSYQFIGTIKTPQNYTISELPKPLLISLLSDSQGKCLYKVDQSKDQIRVLYKFDLNEILFPHTEYTAIRDFWGHLAVKNTEMVILKKNE